MRVTIQVSAVVDPQGLGPNQVSFKIHCLINYQMVLVLTMKLTSSLMWMLSYKATPFILPTVPVIFIMVMGLL